MNLYLVLLKAFLNYQLWSRYHAFIDGRYLKENHPEIAKLYLVLPSLHKDIDGDHEPEWSVEDLVLTFKTGYPNSKDSEFTPIFEQLKEIQFEPEKVRGYLETIEKRERAATIMHTALAVSEGRETWEALCDTITENTGEIVPVEEESDFVEDTLDELEVNQHSKSGLRWRLNSLNKNLGSLRKGDFGFVFARPETGKTTFLASEVSHMATQAESLVLWFNNEEQGGKVLLRCYQGSLGVKLEELWGNKEANDREYKSRGGERIKIIKDPAITKRRVEALCKKYKPSLVIFDQIDKIKGFHNENERNDIELKAIYVWARELAKTYCPVIAVCQAGASGEGKRWLTMNDVDNSKTGKQGEADFILGIGKVHDDGLDRVRFLHLSKNKLLGDTDAEESMRHGKWECRIKPEIARYEDF